MGGLSVIHLGFLAATAAAAVPVVIHLLFRQRARRVDVGSLHFLRIVLKDHTRRRRVRRWLLLALRVAGVLLLALLFARPYRRAPEGPGSEREVALLIDRSASMGVGGPDRSPFDRAQRAAEKALGALPNGTTAHLAYFDADGVAPAPKPRVEASLRPGPAASDYGKALAWARDLMVQSRRRHRKVLLFTDLQRSGLDRTPLENFPADVSVEVVDVGKTHTANLAVDEVLPARTDLRSDAPALIAARVFNAGPFAAKDVAVKLVLEGPEKVERTQTVTVEGDSRQVVRFAVPLRRPGLYRGFVEVAGGDSLPFDDRRWLAFEARPADRILLVDGDPGASVYGNETYYLETALRLRLPGRGKAEPVTPYEPTRLAWGPGSSLPDLAPYRVVALCNVADLPQPAASALRDFVAAGGGLVIFTGDRVRPGAYVALQEAGLAPGNVLGPAEPGQYRFASWEKGHPLLAPFADPQHGDLRVIAFRRITRVEPVAGARVLASTRGGQPLVVERDSGRGKVLLFASAADNGWGDWAINRLYLPLVHQVMGYLTGRLAENGRVGAKLARAEPGEAPGVARRGDRLIVRNIDPRESEIARSSADELRASLGLPALKTAPPDEDDPLTPPPDSQRPDELWRYAAWGLLVILVAETFLANRTYA
jgi:hypothetical protein